MRWAPHVACSEKYKILLIGAEGKTTLVKRPKCRWSGSKWLFEKQFAKMESGFKWRRCD